MLVIGFVTGLPRLLVVQQGHLYHSTRIRNQVTMIAIGRTVDPASRPGPAAFDYASLSDSPELLLGFLRVCSQGDERILEKEY
jgi:hypothetical protein